MEPGGEPNSLFAFRGLRIALRSNAPAPLRWLEEFFGPHLAPQADGSPNREVCLDIDPQRYAWLLAESGLPGARPIDAFAVDGAFERLALWRETPNGRVLHDVRAEAFLSIGADRGTIAVTAHRDHARMRILLMRVVRELAMLQALHRGDLVIHGAAAVHRGRTIVIAGQKRSGKTTMLLDRLRRTQTQYLSNDRVLVGTSEESLVYGLPTIVRIREDSFRYLPALTAPASHPPHRHYLTMRECAEGSRLIEPPTRPLPSMSPAQFCRWLGVEPRAAAPPGMLVFPRVDSSVDRFVLRDLDAGEAAARLHGSLFTAGPAGLVSEALGAGWDGKVLDRAGTFEACQRFVRLVAVCECRIGPLAFHAPGVWDAITMAGTPSLA